jgi:hypothetical protein
MKRQTQRFHRKQLFSSERTADNELFRLVSPGPQEKRRKGFRESGEQE